MAKRKLKLCPSAELITTTSICHRDLIDRQRDEEATAAEMHKDTFISSTHKHKPPLNIQEKVVNDGS